MKNLLFIFTILAGLAMASCGHETKQNQETANAEEEVPMCPCCIVAVEEVVEQDSLK